MAGYLKFRVPAGTVNDEQLADDVLNSAKRIAATGVLFPRYTTRMGLRAEWFSIAYTNNAMKAAIEAAATLHGVQTFND